MTLIGLASMPLTGPAAVTFARCTDDCRGRRVWRERKRSELHDLLALAERAPRLTVLEANATVDLRVVIGLRMPVPRRAGDDDLVVGDEAVVGIRYPEPCLLRALPGTSFAQVLWPLDVFHPSVKRGPVQPVCLGITLPQGIRLLEIVLMVYRAIVLQEHNLDERDHAGVFHVEAARWWQQNTHRIPLTTEPFLLSSGAEGGEGHA